MWDLTERYLWAEELAARKVWTVAITEDGPLDNVIALYGGDPSEPNGGKTFASAEAEASQRPGEFFVAQFFEDEHNVIVIENNGWTGAVSEIARRASKRAEHFVSFYHGHGGMAKILEAVDGEVTANFDPVMVGQPAGEADLTPLWARERVAEFKAHPMATSFAVMERQTGVEILPSWFTMVLPTYRIPDPDAMLKDVPNPRRA